MTTNPELPRPVRGEVWLIDWSPGRGSEQLGRRPALIVQNDMGNQSRGYTNTIVVAISTKGKNVPLHVRIPKSKSNGLREDSFVKCEQVMTISKSRLVGRAWGRLTSEQMRQVNTAVAASLGLPELIGE
ncbi:MAG TPA: type II toxin-antitoxin system PemK/MazF family toxin [Humisphaera sp.]|nr:type II toxin-antitoxin system PemK/MazF family toxin [Humisphaera sp.]